MAKITEKTKNSKHLQAINVLLLGKRTRKVCEIKRLLAKLSHNACLTEDFADSVKRLRVNHYGIIIVTDSLGVKLNSDFLSRLKTLLPHAKVLCLVDQIKEETERDIRGTGLIFLGTYEHFGKLCKDILQSAAEMEWAEPFSPSGPTEKQTVSGE
ncbi:MAG: hypothetical protein H8E17_04350 [Deltaproteobacteria bacterium]|nr:hypothetical protein [Deltaproteobacteria bacterium]